MNEDNEWPMFQNIRDTAKTIKEMFMRKTTQNPDSMEINHSLEESLRLGQLEGLRHALALVKGRRILNRPPAYLAAVDEMEIFLKAAIERVEQGEDMNATAIVQ